MSGYGIMLANQNSSHGTSLKDNHSCRHRIIVCSSCDWTSYDGSRSNDKAFCISSIFEVFRENKWKAKTRSHSFTQLAYPAGSIVKKLTNLHQCVPPWGLEKSNVQDGRIVKHLPVNRLSTSYQLDIHILTIAIHPVSNVFSHFKKEAAEQFVLQSGA